MTQQTNDEDLFAAALIMPSVERGGFLARACGADAAALSRLIGLLDAFDDAAHFVRAAPAVSPNAVEEIRSYRLLRELGEGGCGIAYLAEQLAPVKRQVAVKVIKPGMDTMSVVTRFEAERQLLALMDHPNVAKVFDAGSTSAGRPYFVMELVRGIGITQYCDRIRASITERLQLFIQVCQAIQHAHHKGVMHRDIKPSNVLVTMHDGLPLVKVIDFGIAKATQGPLSEQTCHTAIEQLIGTPAYISPEQTELGQRNVDTRSDIYSLGVLLYELLTGCTPFDASDLARSSAEELRRRVREEEPPTPSARLKALQRSGGEVRRDLDWIVMRCLEKQPDRRYQTVYDLLLDVRRHLHHEPIVARPPSVSYVIAKFARRKRALFASIVASAISLVVLAVSTTIQSQRIAAARDDAEQQAEKARQASNVVLAALTATDPVQTYGADGSPHDVLDALSRSVASEFDRQSDARARLTEVIGVAYRRRGKLAEAIRYLREAVQLRAGAQDPDHFATLNAMAELAEAHRLNDDLRSTHRALVNAAEFAAKFRLERSRAYARVLMSRGRYQIQTGDLTAAIEHLKASVQLFRELPGNRMAIADSLLSLQVAWRFMDEWDEAEAAWREVAAIITATVPPLHPDRITLPRSLADIRIGQRRFVEAKPLLVEALHSTERVFGRNNWRVAEILESLTRVSAAQGQLEEAEDFARQALVVNTNVAGDQVWSAAYYRTTLAAMLSRRGKYQEAERELRQALTIYGATTAADNPYWASAEYFLGEVLLATDRLAEAESVLTASLKRWTSGELPGWRAARSASALGEALYRQGKVAEGARYMSESLRTLASDRKAEMAATNAARARVERYVKQQAPHREDTKLASGGSP
jgi:serine/threonine protein kinase